MTDKTDRKGSTPRIGVLCFQGDVREHLAVLETLGVEAEQVNRPEQFEGLHGLVIPGGESTTIGKLLHDFGVDKVIRKRCEEGMAVLGTCAGLILLARDIENSQQPRLGVMNITAARNAFGRQIQSFEADIEVPAFGPPAIRAVFIRAPYISEVGREVETLAEFNGRIVLARQGRIVAAAFHPELVGETRLHKYFLGLAAEAA